MSYYNTTVLFCNITNVIILLLYVFLRTAVQRNQNYLTYLIFYHELNIKSAKDILRHIKIQKAHTLSPFL